MDAKVLLFFLLAITSTFTAKTKNVTEVKTIAEVKKNLEHHEMILTTVNKNKAEVDPIKITNVVKAKIVPVIPKKVKLPPKMIPPLLIQTWAKEISNRFIDNENIVVRRAELLKSFSDIKIEYRNGSAIADKMAKSLEALLKRRARAAEEIMRKAEELADTKTPAPTDYTFDHSVNLDHTKRKIPSYEMENPWEKPLNCSSLEKVKLHTSNHFDGQVSLDTTSVHVALEVFDCKPDVIDHMHWSEGLLSTFQKNYAQDASLDFQYFCSAKGFLRHYPAALWDSMFKLKLDAGDVYDCRLRPWYVSAGGAPRDVLILVDASGSMDNSSNQVVAEQFTLALLSALTDDDQVNVLRFNVVIQSPIPCFNDKLVPANHVNSAAMMAAMKLYKMTNETRMADVLEYAVRMLQKQKGLPNRPKACQQAIVLLTDSMYENFSEIMRLVDPHGRIRLFVLWLHDPFGLRDNTRSFADWLTCDHDGYYAELITHSDVTEQVLNILRVLERPLVAQREKRLRVFSDVYAHVEDPRRGEYYWQQKERTEQVFRYKELRRHKDKLLSDSQRFKDYVYQVNLDKYGYYYEGEDLNYRLQISVSVPVFDDTTSENITIKLNEEKQRNSTRTYPVNRLLGVAGVDIPIDHLKLILPYHQLGAGGMLFLVDHRGNIVLHDNVKPTFDGDILKPGYRTVDFLDLEQPAKDHFPRHYPPEWLKFRKTLIIDRPSGNTTMYAKNVFEEGMRVNLEMREYHWRRVLEHYTAVVVLPPYNRYHAVPETTFTKELAEEALQSLSRTEYVVHPDWLYCRHVEPHFDSREAEVLHFIRRRSDEPKFAMEKLKHFFSPIPPTLLDKTYQCDEDLMARLCKEAIATDKWAKEHEEPDTERDCSTCELGSTTAFFASESGLTRWQQYHATSQHAQPPNASWWPRGPTEPWYRRAAASPDLLVIHAPVTPIRKLRITDAKPPNLGIRAEWLTAARTLGSADKGIIGVAGYHFFPQHLVDLLHAVTNFPCAEDDEDDCEPRCDGKIWSCMLIDEGGWVVARENVQSASEVREHLATLHPTAMGALLNASVFELNWLHDYQGVCFPPIDEKAHAAAPMISSLLRSMWHSIITILRVTQEMALLLTVISTGAIVSADTEFEKEKRRKRLRRDYEREKYERLYDSRVLVNRTRFAACDRSRAFYVLQRTQKAKEALKRPPKLCSWPLVGAEVPKTNLLLLAIYTRCPYRGRPIPDPLVNQPYLEVDDTSARQSSAARLACWRNREPLPGRQPHTSCYPHNYSQEMGYRQCGPWLPDPEKEDGASHNSLSHIVICAIVIIIISSLKT